MPVQLQGHQDATAVADTIAKEGLFGLKNALMWAMIASSSPYDEYFNSSPQIGDTITIKKPFFAKAIAGNTMHVNTKIDRTTTFKVDQQYNSALSSDYRDIMFTVEDYSERYVMPCVTELGTLYDEDIAKGIEKFYLYAGKPGVPYNTQVSADVNAVAERNGIPINNRSVVILNPEDRRSLTKELIQPIVGHTGSTPAYSRFPSSMVSQAVERAFQGDLGGWNCLQSSHIPYYSVVGIGASVPKIKGASQRGATIVTDGWHASVAGKTILKKGTIIEIAGIQHTQKRGTRRSTGKMASFVVTEDVVAPAVLADTTSVSIKIYPEINAGTSDDTLSATSGVNLDQVAAAMGNGTIDASAFQTVTEVPADNAPIGIVGVREPNIDTDGTGNVKKNPDITTPVVATPDDEINYYQTPHFHRDALIKVPMVIPTPNAAFAAGVATCEETGISISYLSDFEIATRTEQERMDIFFGTDCVYPELGIRVITERVKDYL